MHVVLRRFSLEDVPLKVRWINDPANNRFLHYQLPLEEQATLDWYYRIKSNNARLDLTILCDCVPVGIIGLLNIDAKNENAEMYITVGESEYKGKGIAGIAIESLLRLAFFALGLNRVFLLTETENIAAIRAYEKCGFMREGCLRNELRRSDGSYVSRYLYAILKDEFEQQNGATNSAVSNCIFGTEQ